MITFIKQHVDGEKLFDDEFVSKLKKWTDKLSIYLRELYGGSK